ncbi:hypothetical protein PHK61_31100 [Actinomycetospora lutea]|uniref:hypothetical protein n=1 Tax=Actinomycetospora lutea TaxID=663604 RepID=UPI0023669968|nr:hypothetical protein [Actinomycetospora lutea]MDD7942869.1 hypothetical protein [Actinomycetospora lutea]
MVKVRTRNSDEPIEHGAANNIRVVNSVLYVQIGNASNVVAVYNADEWKSAVVE